MLHNETSKFKQVILTTYSDKFGMTIDGRGKTTWRLYPIEFQVVNLVP